MCPFIPVSNVTMEECVRCSREFGEKLAREMGVPVFLYEQAQDKQYRKSLTQIRKGNYEGLEEKVNLAFSFWLGWKYLKYHSISCS